MKNLLVLISVLSIICIYASASHSAQYWAKAYGGSGVEDVTSVQQTSDGGFVVAGSTDSFNVAETSFWILKLNVDGEISWQKSFNWGGPALAFSMQQTADDGFIITGKALDTVILDDYFPILKLDNSGNVSWQKIYYYGQALDVEQTSDGGYVVAGGTCSKDACGASVLKLDSNGDFSWQKIYEKGGGAYNIQQTSDGGYVVAGGADEGYWIVKLDSYGDVVWEKVYGGSSFACAYNIQQTYDGGYIVGGQIYSSLNSGWILKLNNAGNILWQKVNEDSYASSIRQTIDGGYIVAGYDNDCGFYIQKLDEDGEVFWSKAYKDIYPYSELDSIKQISDGGYIVSGHSSSFGTTNGDIVLMKLDNVGEIPYCYVIETCVVALKNTFETAKVIYSNVQSAFPSSVNLTITDQDTEAVVNVICEAGVATSSTSSSSTTSLPLPPPPPPPPPTTSVKTTTTSITNPISTSTTTMPTPDSTTTTSSDSITTTSLFDICTIEEIYGNYSEETELLRYVRDNILSTTTEGQEIIKLYYKWSPVIVNAMKEDDAFEKEVKGVIDGVLELISAETE